MNELEKKYFENETPEPGEKTRESETAGQGEGKPERRKTRTTERRAEYKFGNPEIKTVDSAEADAVLERMDVRGDSFYGQSLTAEIIKQEGLLPKYKVETKEECFTEKASFYFSPLFEFKTGRSGVICYVKDEKRNTVWPRAYYYSNSHAVWKYLPSYESEGGFLSYFNKGFGEESITLPVTFQKALADISQEKNNPLKLKNVDLAIAGTARRKLEDATYHGTIGSKPIKLEGDIYGKGTGRYHEMTPPEQIELPPRLSPDFSKLLASWKQKSNLYGQVQTEVYPSRNGELKFMFCRDERGRIWIAGVENSSMIQNTGLRKAWIDAGDLTTPAYEYPKIVNTGYGDKQDQKGHYYDMFSYYLSKIPIIREYADHLGLSKEPDQETTPERYFKVGDEVPVLVKGKKQAGWIVMEYDGDDVIVAKWGGDKLIKEKIPEKTLKLFQKIK